MATLDREKILQYEVEVRESFNVLNDITSKNIDEFILAPMMVRAMKYTLIILVEAICNICRHILAKKACTMVEEYMEAIVKMGERGFLSETTVNQLIPLTKLRHQLIHGYWKTDNRRLFMETKENLKTIDEFISEIHHLISPPPDK